MNPPGRSEPPTPEVRPYLLRLVAILLLGIALMASVATWAWNTYGGKLQQRPPLPSGTPLGGQRSPADQGP